MCGCVRLCTAGIGRNRLLASIRGKLLSSLDLGALIVDGVHFAQHCCVVALGIDIDGAKQPLSLVKGSTENARQRPL